MNYGEIKKTDIGNGEGVRVSLFVSGCTHHCQGCFNRETWDFSYGKPFTEETQQEIVRLLNADYISGLSILGGEPFEPENQRALLPLLRQVKERYPGKNIWCYTGYLFDRELLKESRARCEVTDEILSLTDVLVDGEFIQEQRNISLRFRGSENQRIIDVPKSLKEGRVCLKEE
ncbi:anaerobic ribonucleoside-triphosphate reductase activating protein [Eubacterium sp. 14-2]|uniref:anaerobic ribonucleoside-triphosphate reductase activating protein n=1 Tax=Eubacterium sp. 14-2 TaxID=1235790 RepID=UPI00033EFCE9|nr:anaerobic ribonucleoside-triphosphate reductase activating protein [Eubacterium sp. 14-2]EOT28697.1 anaerobic ribonucleoside-triphosphate reductase activating protein [Eubacterium sp. 14-2]